MIKENLKLKVLPAMMIHIYQIKSSETELTYFGYRVLYRKCRMTVLKRLTD